MPKLLSIGAAVMLAACAFAAPSVTDTPYTYAGVTRIDIRWNASTNTGGTASCTAELKMYAGRIEHVVFDQDAGQYYAPDVTLTDVSGVDVLQGAGENVTSNADKQVVVEISSVLTNGVQVTFCDALTFTVTNASPSASGTVRLYLR